MQGPTSAQVHGCPFALWSSATLREHLEREQLEHNLCDYDPAATEVLKLAVTYLLSILFIGAFFLGRFSTHKYNFTSVLPKSQF